MCSSLGVAILLYTVALEKWIMTKGYLQLVKECLFPQRQSCSISRTYGLPT